MKHVLLGVLLCLTCLSGCDEAIATCDKNSIHYLNCNAGQLIDICNNIAFWKVRKDCCIDDSVYVIRTEKISAENRDFYAPYITSFNTEVYHCLLKTNE